MVFGEISECHAPCTKGGSKEGRLGRSLPPKPTKVALLSMILYNSENSIRDVRLFCRPLYCHSSIVNRGELSLPGP